MSDNIDPYLESLRDTRESLEGFVEHANSQFSWMGADIMRIGAETGRLGVEMVRLSEQTRLVSEQTRQLSEQTIQLGEKIQRSTAESQERYHQVFGRLRLNEKKLEAMLGATDSDRKDLRQVCHDLDRRLTEVEKRLSA